jgi:hypothetical protein
MKICNKCKTEKPLTEFHKRKDVKSGLLAVCKNCVNTRVRLFQSKEEGYKNTRKKYLIKYKYGITQEQFLKLKDSQNNKCAICQDSLDGEKNCHIDHCHTTKKVRGILCKKCNLAIGLLRDSPKILQSAINYLA